MQRQYPNYPIPAVSGLIINPQGEVLLVQRAHEPGKGQWSLPGGMVNLGETLQQALRREVEEECGIKIEVIKLLAAFDRIFRDDKGSINYHYVVINFLCRWKSGLLCTGSDSKDARWYRPEELSMLDITPGVGEFILQTYAEENIK
ncbi:NUDIX hydrolase [candidate division KSB1 bacterium]|nr:MAG: NUDIX hydrolase [candidate division KSB1 bacterium]RKY80346.1 MAG: NUDIX hydrolase [candidate division KSB1 bacterium]RKY86293.1 MAG: NUDIX hydrolase [candidate division KSB1 bacterium]RKY86707.1 MAG: NUDIX hydrolase [candidate division KSB1 bacterium]HDI52043.1 NUDIX domain-containing protein [Bacteroidota bacterium]